MGIHRPAQVEHKMTGNPADDQFLQMIGDIVQRYHAKKHENDEMQKGFPVGTKDPGLHRSRSEWRAGSPAA